MSITICGYVFDEPYTSIGYLEDSPGVYVILCYQNNEWEIIDVGESETVRSRIETHDRKDCWKESCNNTLKYAPYYTNSQEWVRKRIERDIRDRKPNITCGKS